MAHNVSLASVRKLQERVGSLMRSNRTLKEKGPRAMLAIADSAVVNAGAFSAGIAQGYFGEKRILGIWWELYATAAFHAAGVFIDTDGASRQLHNLADGISSAWSSAMGRGVGLSILRKGGGRRPSLKGLEDKLAQLEGLSNGGGMADDEEMFKLARRM